MCDNGSSDWVTRIPHAGSDVSSVGARSPEPSPRITIDCLGDACPVPIIRLARSAAGLPDGTEIELLTDDNAAIHDVPAWCRLRGATYLGRTLDSAGPVTHLIRLGLAPGTGG